MTSLISLDNYKIFYEVAKCKNITRASEKLFISQPAVSQAVKKLEDELGVKLIIRLKRGILLTKVGEKVFEKVEVALNNLALIEQIIEEDKGLISGELKIGAGSNIARKILCEPVVDFIKRYNKVNISMNEGLQTDMIAKLKTGELDFVITQKNEEIQMPFIPIFETTYCFVKAKDCNVDKFVTIGQGSFTYGLFEKFVKKEKLENVSTMQVSGYKTALEVVKNGVGTTLLPKYLVQELLNDDVLQVVYNDYKLPIITFGAYYNQELLTPASVKFMEILKQERQ